MTCCNRTSDSNSMSSWCGWHTDHGSLTGDHHRIIVIRVLFYFLFIENLGNLQSFKSSSKIDKTNLWMRKQKLIENQLFVLQYDILIVISISIQFSGLTCGMFLRDGVEVPCPDSAAGLYIQTRSDQIVKVNNSSKVASNTRYN